MLSKSVCLRISSSRCATAAARALPQSNQSCAVRSVLISPAVNDINLEGVASASIERVSPETNDAFGSTLCSISSPSAGADDESCCSSSSTDSSGCGVLALSSSATVLAAICCLGADCKLRSKISRNSGKSDVKCSTSECVNASRYSSEVRISRKAGTEAFAALAFTPSAIASDI